MNKLILDPIILGSRNPDMIGLESGNPIMIRLGSGNLNIIGFESQMTDPLGPGSCTCSLS
uniref:Uncharacterized protein n=1 Tax=Romanomermis culicivorax TaxID=13658 RepID=A0A915L0J2_ROMCU